MKNIFFNQVTTEHLTFVAKFQNIFLLELIYVKIVY